ncbi:MAG: hypothetical protein M3546_08205 [Actinomycetota bacterium]|nr:hypothetical protein [Actinomycetota bacterium]
MRRRPLYALYVADSIPLVVNAVAQLAAVAAIPLLQSTVGIKLWQLMALVVLGVCSVRSVQNYQRNGADLT